MISNPQVTIKFDIPPDMLNGFKPLLEVIRNKIIRQAIRSALVPAKNVLKAHLMALTGTSIQSSGASLRSITTKFGQSKANPDRFYGLVGPNNAYFEAFNAEEKSPKFRKAKMRQVTFGIYKTRPNRDGVRVLSRRWQPGETRSFLRRGYGKRGTLNNSGWRKRWPKKYWHLVERGFNRGITRGRFVTNKPVSFSGHHFVAKTTAETRDQAIQIFEAKVREGIRKIT